MYESMLPLVRSFPLFVRTAGAEIVGCFLPYLWMRDQARAWMLIPAAGSLVLFAWLLTLHPTGAGRTYAAYGGVYVSAAVLWVWLIEGQRPDRWDILGAGLCVLGAAVIVLAPRS